MRKFSIAGLDANLGSFSRRIKSSSPGPPKKFITVGEEADELNDTEISKETTLLSVQLSTTENVLSPMSLSHRNMKPNQFTKVDFTINDALKTNEHLASKLKKETVGTLNRNEHLRTKMFVLKDEKAFKNDEKKLDYNQIVNMLVRVLSRQAESRSKNQVSGLVPLIQEVPFFKERGLKGSNLVDVVSCMNYKSVEKDNFVFEIGEKGDLFYFILRGEVEVMIPNKEQIQDFKKVNNEIDTKRKFLSHINEELNEIDPKVLECINEKKNQPSGSEFLKQPQSRQDHSLLKRSNMAVMRQSMPSNGN